MCPLTSITILKVNLSLLSVIISEFNLQDLVKQSGEGGGGADWRPVCCLFISSIKYVLVCVVNNDLSYLFLKGEILICTHVIVLQ